MGVSLKKAIEIARSVEVSDQCIQEGMRKWRWRVKKTRGVCVVGKGNKTKIENKVTAK